MKEQKGITLIALVITIIVLLILAGVTIAMLSGENGILTNANKSNCQNSYRSAEEQMGLAYMSVRTEIMAQKVTDSTYDPTGSKANEYANLIHIVKEDLGIEKKNADGTYTPVTGTNLKYAVDNSDTSVIKITYTDTAIDKGLISASPVTPKNDTKVVGRISLDKTNQTASFAYDTDVID